MSDRNIFRRKKFWSKKKLANFRFFSENLPKIWNFHFSVPFYTTVSENPFCKSDRNRSKWMGFEKMWNFWIQIGGHIHSRSLVPIDRVPELTRQQATCIDPTLVHIRAPLGNVFFINPKQEIIGKLTVGSEVHVNTRFVAAVQYRYHLVEVISHNSLHEIEPS